MQNELVERVARIFEPQAWAALGTGDTLAYKNQRISSQLKATLAVAFLMDEAAKVAREHKATGYMSDRERDYCHEHGEEIAKALERLGEAG